jgi:RHS repeat-associated protein
MNKTEYKLYYFNANHLCSGSLITDGSGNTYQTLAYAPFVEILVNEFSGDYDEAYKFTGYERDRESGLDYAHARYYWSNGSIFSTTDLHWFNSPDITSYAYCANNPIMYYDPTGMDTVPANEVWNYDKINYHTDGSGIHETNTFLVGKASEKDKKEGISSYHLHLILTGENKGNYMAIAILDEICEITGENFYEYKYIVGKYCCCVKT